MQGACLKLLVCALVLGGLAGCWRPPGIGVGGKYNDALTELGKTQRGGNVNRAIVDLEYVARKNPRYKDSLTQLGRAYYYAGRYSAAIEVLKRAVTVNRDDEVAWIVIGLTQLRRGDDEAGLASVKGGLTLLAKATRNGYKDFKEEYWDRRGVVRGLCGAVSRWLGKGLAKSAGYFWRERCCCTASTANFTTRRRNHVSRTGNQTGETSGRGCELKAPLLD